MLSDEDYESKFNLLLRRLGKADKITKIPAEEYAQLQKSHALLEEKCARYEDQVNQYKSLSIKGKSDELINAINNANNKYPSHAIINNMHAFEVSNTPITLDYLLWSISKAMQRGSHPLDMLFTLDNKWSEALRMIDAYMDTQQS
ncbi:hypothetical protein [Cysteiniphilum marinum]|uniref:hypothetical protein n=1 Tax=Cysteiniphilum marinum TaxID=2774191 RepID=UPI00193C5417|nr:hypothetical protein [Cysteiniphilum marinum]